VTDREGRSGTSGDAPRGEESIDGQPGTPRRLLRVTDLLARVMAYISGALFLLVSFYVAADVIGRNFFHVSSAVSDEIGGYVLALGGMWALAHTLRTGAHVRIDILLPYLPLGVQYVLNYMALLAMALVSLLVAFYSWSQTIESLTTDARAMSFIRTPLFIPQGLMSLGLSVLSLEAIVLFALGVAESSRLGRIAPPDGFETPSRPA
jgi:TRAP-type C4-dicarboxylate transport system permease small subunit